MVNDDSIHDYNGDIDITDTLVDAHENDVAMQLTHLLQLHLYPSLLVGVECLVLLLLRIEEEDLFLARRVVLERDPLDVQVLPADQSLHRTHLQGL